jgi:hypothetical protein
MKNKIYLAFKFNFIVHLIFFALLSSIFLLRTQSSILFTGDLYHNFTNAIVQLNKENLLSQTMNLLVYGNADYGINSRLIFSFNLANLVPLKYITAAVYVGFSLEMFVSIYVAGRLFEQSRQVSLAAAWLTPFLILPYTWPNIIWVELSTIITGLYTASAVFILTAGVIYQIGKGGWIRSILLTILLLLLEMYSVIALTQFAVLIVFLSGWVAIGSLLLANNHLERIKKLILIALTFGVLIMLNVDGYIRDYYKYNWYELMTQAAGRPAINPIDLLVVSMRQLVELDLDGIFHMARVNVPGRIGFWFTISVLGWAFAVVLFNRLLALNSETSKFAKLFLITIFGYLTWQWAYLEAILIPIWGLMFANLIITFPLFLIRMRGLIASHYAIDYRIGSRISIGDQIDVFISRSFILIVTAYILFSILNTNKGWPAYIYGSLPRGAISEALIKNIRIDHTSEFKGRVANVMTQQPPPLLPDKRVLFYEAQQAIDHEIAFSQFGKGGDFRQSLLATDIPLLFDVNRFISPGAIATMNYFLTENFHFKQAQFLYPSKINEKWMKFFGIRYLITSDQLDSGYRLLASQKYQTYTIYLYEVADPNIGGYSPVMPFVSKSLKRSLDLMGEQSFDFKNDFIVSKAIEEKLTAAKNIRIFFSRGKIKIMAESESRSVIVIPFEYSNCLKLSDAELQANKIELIRVNNHQIGIIFNTRLNSMIELELGLINYSRCRGQDIEQWLAEEVGQVKTYNNVGILGNPP